MKPEICVHPDHYGEKVTMLCNLRSSILVLLMTLIGLLSLTLPVAAQESAFWPLTSIEAGGHSAQPRRLTKFRGELYFLALSEGDSLYVPETSELWKSDGTPEGTIQVLNMPIVNGCETQAPFVHTADTLYFCNGWHALWKSDGTATGTVEVIKFAEHEYLRTLVTLGDTLYFTLAGSNSEGDLLGLWQSDGTADGTRLISTLGSPPTTDFGVSRDLVTLGDTLYFIQYNEGYGLWALALGATQPRLVQTLPGIPNRVTRVGNALYVTTDKLGAPSTLWQSDGTTAGTRLIKEFAEANSLRAAPHFAFKNHFYFMCDCRTDAESPVHYQLWRSDGTVNGTVSVDLGIDWWHYTQVEVIDEYLYILAGFGPFDLWGSDGTQAGTTKLYDDMLFFDLPGPPVGAIHFEEVNGQVYTTLISSIYGTELGRIATAPYDVELVADVNPGSNGPAFSALTPSTDGVYFTIRDELPALRGLWHSDGTLNGTTQIGNTVPREMLDVNGTLYYLQNVATDGAQPQYVRQLWKRSSHTGKATLLAQSDVQPDSNWTTLRALDNGRVLFFEMHDDWQRSVLWGTAGTPESTVPLQQGLSTSHYLQVDELAYFIASDQRSIWQSDGTPAGTFALVPAESELALQQIESLVHIDDALYFVANHEVHGESLWRHQGAPGETVLLADISVDNSPFTPRYMLRSAGHKLFVAQEQANNFSLWVSDGSPSGTARIVGPTKGSVFYGPGDTQANDGRIYFAWATGATRSDLWLSDGTEAGTMPVTDLNPDLQGREQAPKFARNGVLYLQVTSPLELWQTDGTAAGTHVIQSLPGGIEIFDARDDHIYFVTDNRAQEYQLWHADGTTAGAVTRLITNQWVNILGEHNGHVYFGTSDTTNGYLLWRTDGTAAGTHMLSARHPDSGANLRYLRSEDLVIVNDILYFYGNDGTSGNQLWAYNTLAPTALPSIGEPLHAQSLYLPHIRR